MKKKSVHSINVQAAGIGITLTLQNCKQKENSLKMISLRYFPVSVGCILTYNYVWMKDVKLNLTFTNISFPENCEHAVLYSLCLVNDLTFFVALMLCTKYAPIIPLFSYCQILFKINCYLIQMQNCLEVVHLLQMLMILYQTIKHCYSTTGVG